MTRWAGSRRGIGGPMRAVHRLERALRRSRGTLIAVATLLGLLSASPAASATAEEPHSSDGVRVPQGVTTGIAVFDRETGTFTEQLNADKQFRSASVMKLLITLDYLWNRGPDYDIPAADRSRLQVMLRSSANDPASYYWASNGGTRIIERMVRRLDLTGTEPPPSGYPGYWGYTAITAADTVRIYRYILDSAPRPCASSSWGTCGSRRAAPATATTSTSASPQRSNAPGR